MQRIVFVHGSVGNGDEERLHELNLIRKPERGILRQRAAKFFQVHVQLGEARGPLASGAHFAAVFPVWAI